MDVGRSGWTAEQWSENAQVTPTVLTRGVLGKQNIPNYTAVAKLFEVVNIYPEDAIRCFHNTKDGKPKSIAHEG
ncbi:MAG: hypothetical protein CMF67_00745 [Magnetovibrio sp.]|nr:hypothetical protein [Magnetovibrio sp.]|tara:strand:+ start:582 stop:803 length:222 start_codon:yes stop_codon:yes gene_type:complete